MQRSSYLRNLYAYFKAIRTIIDEKKPNNNQNGIQLQPMTVKPQRKVLKFGIVILSPIWSIQPLLCIPSEVPKTIVALGVETFDIQAVLGFNIRSTPAANSWVHALRTHRVSVGGWWNLDHKLWLQVERSSLLLSKQTKSAHLYMSAQMLTCYSPNQNWLVYIHNYMQQSVDKLYYPLWKAGAKGKSLWRNDFIGCHKLKGTESAYLTGIRPFPSLLMTNQSKI